MDKVFKYFNDFTKGLTGLIMGLLTLGIVATFLFGGDGFFGLDVVGNIAGVLDTLTTQTAADGTTAGGGVIGLIGLLIVWNLISSK
jgi:hypothetical protein